jgi:hypothetical protein
MNGLLTCGGFIGHITPASPILVAQEGRAYACDVDSNLLTPRPAHLRNGT